ncbi:ferredoxin-dependent bilin reductase-domain-containing protein [Baffinella frigidus]|nr:ferredoxin-dependent bilin reductase-domain-containing protein [Cryptophyta sp. CCMP2293]
MQALCGRMTEALCGRMTERFYDEKEFFSSQLLFGRFDNPAPVKEFLFPAMCEYVEYYVKMMKEQTPNEDPAFMAKIEQLHEKYDQYSAEKDPAAALFAANWGHDWAESFVYDFLFDKAEVPAGGSKFIKRAPTPCVMDPSERVPEGGSKFIKPGPK